MSVRTVARHTGRACLGVLGAKGKSTSICEPGDPKAGLYAHFVRAGAEATTVSMSRCVGDALSIVPTTAS